MCSGRVVACNTRGTHLESSKRPIFIVKIFPVNCLKDKNKEKEAGNGHFKKNRRLLSLPVDRREPKRPVEVRRGPEHSTRFWCLRQEMSRTSPWQGRASGSAFRTGR